jgi:DNA transposition AAA+ family ATPase
MTNNNHGDFVLDEATRGALEKYIWDNEWTHARMALRLSFSATRVTKYLNLNKDGNRPEPDARRVQTAAKQFLRHVGRLAQMNESLFVNSISRAVSDTLTMIRRSGDVGLIHSAGGRGKTSGALLYCRDNANTLFMTVKQWAAGSHACGRMLFEEYCASSDEDYPNNLSRSDWLEQQLKGAERLIVVDDAELMDITGFKYFFSLQDATGVPIGLIGNTQVIDKIVRNDPAGKLISRIGIVQEVSMGNDAEDTAQRLIEQFAPNSGTELVTAATDVVVSGGYCRRLRKQLALTNVIHEQSKAKGKAITWSDAFAAAASKLIAPRLQTCTPMQRRRQV